jgi:hypothetical protein
MNPAVMTVFLKKKVPQTLALAAVFVAFSGCGTQQDPDVNNPQKKLLTNDLQELSSYDNSGAVALDQQANGIFTQVFGGTSGADLTSYLNTRIHYYVDKDEDITVSPSDYSVKGWTEDQNATENAENISIEYWILGLINNVTVSFEFQDQTVNVTSARTGIVILDDGYSDKVQFNGAEVDAPSFYRQSILLHEARHSDCTGGLSEGQLNSISRDESSTEFSAHGDAGHCGHLHVVCPDGSDYAGLFACDNETYGAYGVQDIFLRAAQLQITADGENHTLVDAMEIDAYSRLINDTSSSDYPDMSSSDIVSP